MTAVAAGRLGQPGLVEGRDLDQFEQLDPLHQQLGNPVAAVHVDRRVWVEVDQRNLDLTTVARIDGARTVDDRKPHAGSQSRARMDQTDHPVGDGDRDARAHQGAMPGCQLDIFGAVQVDTGIAVVRAAGQGQTLVETDYGQTGRHGATDYP